MKASSSTSTFDFKAVVCSSVPMKVIPNYLLSRRAMQPGSVDFGHAFEHLIIQEIIAYSGYHNIENAISYWHTYNDYEVDVVLGDAEVAIEIKSSEEVQSRHLRGLKAFKEEHPEARLIVVSLDINPRLFNGVEIWPAKQFLEQLWAGKIFDKNQKKTDFYSIYFNKKRSTTPFFYILFTKSKVVFYYQFSHST